MKIIKQEIQFEENLKQRLEFPNIKLLSSNNKYKKFIKTVDIFLKLI